MAHGGRPQGRVGKGGPKGEGERAEPAGQCVDGDRAFDVAVGDVVVDGLRQQLEPLHLALVAIGLAHQWREQVYQEAGLPGPDAAGGQTGLDGGGHGLRRRAHRLRRGRGRPGHRSGGGHGVCGGDPRRRGSGPGLDFSAGRTGGGRQIREHEHEDGADEQDGEASHNEAAAATGAAHRRRGSAKGAPSSKARPTPTSLLRHFQLLVRLSSGAMPLDVPSRNPPPHRPSAISALPGKHPSRRGTDLGHDHPGRQPGTPHLIAQPARLSGPRGIQQASPRPAVATNGLNLAPCSAESELARAGLTAHRQSLSIAGS